ncbi:MFS family permease [Streptomyces sp. SAI-133]|jgi:MFS family permease|uniref:MFS transporter n=1 Tax=unclassified Streptomyces TaxID=2593676 RepID=UPI00247717D3|nr:MULTISPECIES: MFS transporter [unclassified Streptomyces]MDH6554367.1 MFS family permease [Streptomyces sp. SAI-041]MDH6581634.1 MFS family permease [Streptomyces sp. SAI-133]
MATPLVQPEGQSGRLGAGASTARHQVSRKLLAAGLVASSIEWYDFFLYGTAAALVFPRVFFPHSSALTGTLLAFSTFWAGFVARPIGGVLAGHLGDKHGRKPVVVGCLALMGAATFLIGCLPSAETVGALAPTLLVLLRFMQGLAAGGQWGGIVLLLTESASPKRRGFAGTFGQTSVPVAVIISNLVFVAAGALMPDDAFLSWGWRIPFLVSVVMFVVVLYIQAKVEDTPEFRALQREASQPERGAVRAPLAQVVRSRWGTVLLGCGLLSATNSLFYVSISGLLSYGTHSLGLERNPLLAVVLLSSVAMLATLPWSGYMSDKVGRRPLILVGGLGVAVWAFPYFWLVDTASLPLIFIAVVVGFVFQCLTYGPIASFVGELFAPSVRYSGASLSYQLSAIIVSGGTPFLMTALIAKAGSTLPVAGYIMLMGLITFASAWFLPETNPAEVRDDPDAVPGAHLYG